MISLNDDPTAVHTIIDGRGKVGDEMGPRTGIWTFGGLQLAKRASPGRQAFFEQTPLKVPGMGKHESQFCEFCSNFLLGDLSWSCEGEDASANQEQKRTMYPHQPGFEPLLTSARNCHLCFQLLFSLDAMLDRCVDQYHEKNNHSSGTSSTLVKNQIFIETFSQIASEADLRRIWCYWKSLEPDSSFYFRGEMLAVGMLHSKNDVFQRAIWSGKSAQRCYDQRLETVKKWVKMCKEDHLLCFECTEPFLPTRIIDVGPPNDSKKPSLILSTGRHGHYITLSYCWGSKTTFAVVETSTTANDEVYLDNLPTLFQDVVYIARKLEIRYVWIDALCIDQNDKKDWERESAFMAKYYGNAFLTIAATAAKHPGDSLMSHFVPTTVISGDGNSFGFRLQPSHIDAHQEVLFQRAWTLQEELLSKKVLYFGEKQLYWQCVCLRASEDSVLDSIRSHFPDSKSTILQMYKHMMPEHTKTNWYRIWYEICAEYSSRDITFEADRIPAIHGLANFFSDILDDIPVLGLWEKNFVESLCWKKNSQPLKRRCSWKTPQNIPSWSWFSSGANIDYDFYGLGNAILQYATHSSSDVFNPAAELRSVHVEWTGAHNSSSIASTNLILRSRMVLVEGAHYEEFIEDQKPEDRAYPQYSKFYRNLDAKLENVPLHIWALELGTVLKGSDIGGTIFLYLAKSNEQPGKFYRFGLGYHSRLDWKDEDIFATSSPQAVSLI